MRIEDPILADSAWSSNNKINAHGIIMGGLTLDALPTRYPSLTVAFAAIVERAEGEKKRVIGAVLLDPNGDELRDAGTFIVYPDFSSPDAVEFYIPVVLTFDGIPFATKGEHVIRIFVDGTEAASVPLSLYPAVD